MTTNTRTEENSRTQLHNKTTHTTAIHDTSHHTSPSTTHNTREQNNTGGIGQHKEDRTTRDGNTAKRTGTT
nr:MAG TPA: hypothetical protein [Caudoviricetes sp.]